MSDRSALKNFSLLGVLAFLVLSSGILQCAYNCIEEGASRSASSATEIHATHVAGCHRTFPEPKQVYSCPNRSCHQSQADNGSLGGQVLANYSSAPEPLLSGSRLPLPDNRINQPLKQRALPQTVLLASWQPPATTSQTLQSVKTTVMLN